MKSSLSVGGAGPAVSGSFNPIIPSQGKDNTQSLLNVNNSETTSSTLVKSLPSQPGAAGQIEDRANTQEVTEF